jgi:hypothetical protein
VTPAQADRGSATAEIAVALPALVLVLGIALAAVQLGVDQVRCVDAARAGARLLGRGDGAEAASAAARAAAPPGAAVLVDAGGSAARVTVRAGAPGVLGAWAGVPGPAATAAAVLEPGPGP